MKALISTTISVAALFGVVALAQAGEQTGAASVNPALLIENVLRQPVGYQQRQIAFDESLRRAGPTPANRVALSR